MDILHRTQVLLKDKDRRTQRYLARLYQQWSVIGEQEDKRRRQEESQETPPVGSNRGR